MIYGSVPESMQWGPKNNTIQIVWSCPNVLMISCAADDSANAILCWAHYCETSSQLYFWNSAFIRCSFYTQSCYWCLKYATFFLNVHFLILNSFAMNEMWVCEICKSLPSVFLLEIIPIFSKLSFFCLSIQLEIPNPEKKNQMHTHKTTAVFHSSSFMLRSSNEW